MLIEIIYSIGVINVQHSFPAQSNLALKLANGSSQTASLTDPSSYVATSSRYSINRTFSFSSVDVLRWLRKQKPEDSINYYINMID